MPGVPSIYYGSEWGITGERNNHSDQALRPALNVNQMIAHAPEPKLPLLIKNLAVLRKSNPALQTGQYRQALVNHQQFAFWREDEHQKILIALNSADSASQIRLTDFPNHHQIISTDLSKTTFNIQDNQLFLTIPPHGFSILIFE